LVVVEYGKLTPVLPLHIVRFVAGKVIVGILNVIVLSVLVLAVLLLVAGSWTLFAAMVAMIVPGPVTVTGTVQVMLSEVVGI
jgi:hypothetical protein